MRGMLEPGARFTVTAAEILQAAYPLARQQPPPGPAQLQPQPARDGNDDTEAGRRAGAAGAQQATGKRKRTHRGTKSTAAYDERRRARRLEELGTQDTQGSEGAMDVQQEAEGPRQRDHM